MSVDTLTALYITKYTHTGNFVTPEGCLIGKQYQRYTITATLGGLTSQLN